MAMISVAVSSGLTVAVKAYRESVFISDAEVLQDTINTAMSDILRYGKYTGTDGDGTLLFGNDKYHILSGGHFVNANGHIYLNSGSAGSDDGDPSTLSLLINTGAYVSLSVENFTIAYDPANLTYSGTYTITSADDLLTKNCSFAYRSLV
ncbi:hypothetical protein SDC9_208073 [bioreactor metagenome]|uniref:Uncharacterized protein n=1 Tax=bioreactor metagenome TaxID=1076179 RepID=A0A645J9H7_9ZZZZ